MSANPRASPLAEVTAKGPVDVEEVVLPKDETTSIRGNSSSPANYNKEEDDDEEEEEGEEHDTGAGQPLELAPPLPTEAPPRAIEDDGWEPVWDDTAQAYYFYNRLTSVTQWENPRVATAPAGPPGAGNHEREPDRAPGTDPAPSLRPIHGGYNPAIHGDYDPNASYAQDSEENTAQPPTNDSSASYTTTGAFNRFTGRWQAADINPELHNDENKSKRQMSAYFDVDAAANSHNGKSLKAERSGKKLSKQELRAFKEKRKEKKEEKRRAWLRD